MTLTSMTDDEFVHFFRKSVRNYAGDLGLALGIHAAKALEIATESFEKLLPQEKETPDHHFNTVRLPDTGIAIGYVWYALREIGGKKHVFIYDLFIEDGHREKGYGTQVMKWVETRAKKHGCSEIILKVFGHNLRAKALYDKMQFQTLSVEMIKKV